MQETLIQFLGQEVPLEKGSATHSNIIGLPWWLRWESACNAGDLGSIYGLGRSPGGEHGNPLQYSCLENPDGPRSLVGYSPWGLKESDTTKHSTEGNFIGITNFNLYSINIFLILSLVINNMVCFLICSNLLFVL